MAVTLAFDVYGTLIDTQGIEEAVSLFLGDSSASVFARLWREKQLEYSFRRGLMQHYQTFVVCTANALDYTCALFDLQLGASEKKHLMDAWATLPAYGDAAYALEALRDAGYRLYAFSNGTAEAVETVLGNAGLRHFFRDVVSVDEVKSFKPNPAVYCHFLRRAGTAGESTWLVSGNPFDVIGAISAGIRSVWIRRGPAVIYDPWGTEPTLVAGSLAELADQFEG